MDDWTFAQQANEKFTTGEAITDAELSVLIARYKKGCEFLEMLGPEFGLARKECRRRLGTLLDYQNARHRA